MTTFFFAVHVENCSSGCPGAWQSCPSRFLSSLRRLDGLDTICTLFGGDGRFSPEPGRFPRNGDLIVLYARNGEDLEMMIGAGEIFEGLKKILVVADPAGIDDHQYHMLAPRYITRAGRDMAELEAVIRKMRHSGSAKQGVTR